MKKLLQFLFLIFVTSVAFSQDISAQSAGFESGNLTGWISSGGVNVSGTSSNNLGGKAWVVTPYGSYMGMLNPSDATTFDSAVSSLGLNSTENTGIRNFLTANNGGGSSTPTNSAWIKKTITLQPGVTYSFAWNYLSTDYTPYNDGSMITLVHSTNNSVTPTLNNSQQRYGLLGFTNPGSGNYSTGSYGSTGWQIATFTVPEAGDYVLGFATFNLGDTVLSPILYIDEVQGTTTLNGQTFNPVAPNEGSTVPTTPTAPTLCCGGSAAPFDADTAKVLKLNQFLNRTTADSIVYIDQIGNSNTITVQQTGTKQNYVNYEGNGSFNTVNITQSGNQSTNVNYVNLVIGSTEAANSNAVNITQTSTGGSKAAFVNISNSNNNLTLQQKDDGNHWADVTLTGGNKTVSIIQQGSAGHMANVILGGTATTLDLTQSGSTQQYYSISHTCATAGGCGTITVNQGN